MLGNLALEHLGNMPRCRIPRETDPVLASVLLEKLGEHAKHLSRVFAWTVEVGDLILREFECGSHDEAALRFLVLRYSRYFIWCYQCSAALSTN